MFNSSKNKTKQQFFFFFKRDLARLKIAVATVPIRVNSRGTGLSVLSRSARGHLCLGEKGPPFTLKVQSVDLLQRGLFEVKEAKFSLAPCLESLEF